MIWPIALTFSINGLAKQNMKRWMKPMWKFIRMLLYHTCFEKSFGKDAFHVCPTSYKSTVSSGNLKSGIWTTINHQTLTKLIKFNIRILYFTRAWGGGGRCQYYNATSWPLNEENNERKNSQRHILILHNICNHGSKHKKKNSDILQTKEEERTNEWDRWMRKQARRTKRANYKGRGEEKGRNKIIKSIIPFFFNI